MTQHRAPRHAARFGWPFPPMAGGDDPPAPDPKPDPPAPDPQPDPKPDPPKPPEGTITVSKAEHDALKRDLAEMRRANKKADDDRKAADESAKAEQGRYKELWETEKQRADGLQGKLDERDAADVERGRKGKWIATAKTLGFKEPEDAYALLAYREKTGSDDPAVIEHELGQLKTERPDWVDKRQRTGADLNTPANGGGTPSVPEHLQGVGEGMARLMRVQRKND